MPNFFIVGAAKCGTTSMFNYLKQHPQVFMPARRKESRFFSGLSPEQFPGPGRRYVAFAVTSWAAYQRLFEGSAACPARGEACTSYLYCYDKAIPRIIDRLGRRVKIIVMLRHPVERAYSNYLQHVRDGVEPLAFEEALEAERARGDEGWWLGFRYQDQGRYYEQVRAYAEAFGSDRMHVVLFDDFEADTARSVQRVFQFLDVDDTFVPDLSRRYNPSGVPRHEALHRFITQEHPVKRAFRWAVPHRLKVFLYNRYLQTSLDKPPLRSETRARLLAVYREDVLRLQELIQRDLSSWLR
jgi:hypothetical protein